MQPVALAFYSGERNSTWSQDKKKIQSSLLNLKRVRIKSYPSMMHSFLSRDLCLQGRKGNRYEREQTNTGCIDRERKKSDNSCGCFPWLPGWPAIEKGLSKKQGGAPDLRGMNFIKFVTRWGFFCGTAERVFKVIPSYWFYRAAGLRRTRI